MSLSHCWIVGPDSRSTRGPLPICPAIRLPMQPLPPSCQEKSVMKKMLTTSHQKARDLRTVAEHTKAAASLQRDPCPFSKGLYSCVMGSVCWRASPVSCGQGMCEDTFPRCTRYLGPTASSKGKAQQEAVSMGNTNPTFLLPRWCFLWGPIESLKWLTVDLFAEATTQLSSSCT